MIESKYSALLDFSGTGILCVFSIFCILFDFLKFLYFCLYFV